jgi:DNA polymerase III subunit delta'
MSFSDVIGQHHAKGILERALEKSRVAHAYLFSGPEGVGKEALALTFTKALFCKSDDERPCDECANCRRINSFQHPDVSFLFPSSAKNVDEERAILDSVQNDPYKRSKPWATPTIGIDKIRELRHQATLKPLEGRRLIIIAEADRMTIPAANSLLKLLEEPPDTMHLVLTASKINSMLPTILSRCQEIRFGPLSDNDIEWALVEKRNVAPEQARILAGMSQGNFRRALDWMDESFAASREAALAFLRTCLKNPKLQIEFVEELVKKNDKKQIKDVLSLMLIWFRDALLLEEAGANQGLVNIDQVDTLEKFLGAFESIDYFAASTEIENSMTMIERNIQINLILVVLMIKLQRMMKLKGRSK